ncbi:LacI family DNA-binding transcriptional regulator [Flavobacterium okayamense]|uniref:LacI family transcriptional regulator n=1 Tax=Flavobacterium okayamense TaxID=2830782 RepID=A0ABM7S3K6_9FLAO|nr:LacI family DNA-binding transcriptional regulator [Flavobacterium okayamense]BCY28115.1 LacI family transcriptional regulator [Flavobacterium okayamense]
MKSKITLKQIAKELGVSVSTVSKALSDSPEIGTVTKTRILEFAELNNYKPNALARNLKNQRTNTIGVIIPNILNPFFAKVFSGIEEKAIQLGYNVITAISNESLVKEKQMMDMLNNGSIDGFILSIAEETQKNQDFKHLKSIMDSGTPIVMFDRVAESLKCDKVVVDDLDSAIDATEYLIKQGAKKIAMLSTIDNLSVGKLRFEGYKEAMSRAGLNLDTTLLVVESDTDKFDKKLESLIQKHKVDAIFAVDEHASTMGMKYAIKSGYKIPEDILVIGFADGVWSKRLTPSLSTVSQHAPEIGMRAAELLIDKIQNEDEFYQPQTIVVKTELRHRDSTKR